MSNITNVHSTTVPLCEIHVDPLMGTSQVNVQVQVHWRLHMQTPYKGISGALWEENHLSEHGCPFAGATGHAY